MNKQNSKNLLSIDTIKNYVPTTYSYKDILLIAEDIQACNMLANYEPTKCIILVICEKGKIRYDIDGHTVIAEAKNILIQTFGQRVSNLKVLSPEFSAKAILINIEYIHYLAQNFCNILRLKQKLLTTDKVELTNKEMKITSTFISQIIDYLAKDEYNNKFGLALDLAKIILQQALNKKNLKTVFKAKEEKNQDKTTFDKFTLLVEENYMTQKQVTNYCERLNISNSCLEKIVYKYTNKTPIKYIHLYLLNKICIMAECTSKKKMSIKAIAEYTHFSTPSALARFVKSELNMSITKYRSLGPEMQRSIIHDTIPPQIAL